MTNHSKFICPYQFYSFEATNRKLNPAIKWNTFYKRCPSLRKCNMFIQAIASCVDAYWLTRQLITVSWYTCDSSSTYFILCRVARYIRYVPRVPRAVQFVRHKFTLGSQRTKKAFRK